MESFQVSLNSEFADEILNGSSDCVFYLPDVSVDSQSYIYVSLVSANIPYSFYNINSSNNFLAFTKNSQQYSYYIPVGNYNVNSLMSQINQDLALYNITLTYNKLTNKYSFSSNLPTTFLNTSTCFQFLGFEPNNKNIDFSLINATYKVNSEIPINLIFYSYLYIYSNLQTYNFSKISQINKMNLLCSIPIDTQPNSMISYRRNTDFKSNTYQSFIPNLEIKICDKYGNIINLNGCDWSMVLQFDIVKFNDEE